MTKSEISGRWLDNFRKVTSVWLAFWRGVGKFLPDSFNKKWVFFWKNIGYGLPSSSFLISRMLRYVEWDGVKQVVELGGGTGVMTRAILEKKNDSTHLTSCEIEKDRYEGLRKYHNNHTSIVHLDAEACLNSFPREGVDIVISTLPLGSMNPIHAREILVAISRALKNDGLYIQYQYFGTNKEDIEKLFYIIKNDWEPINFPPAFIYICKKR
ncbi:MAG: rRNA adenine N-6-methyltransferase family protein [Candidatus Altimarinota bacterium]